MQMLIEHAHGVFGKQRGQESGSRAALLRPGPLRTVLAGCPRTRLKQALKASRRAEVLILLLGRKESGVGRRNG